MRDAGKHLTMLKTSPTPHLKTQNYLSPDVGRTGAEKLCPGAVTLHNQLTTRPNLKSLNLEFQRKDSWSIWGQGPIRTEKRVGICYTNTTAPAIIRGRNERETISRKGIVSRNLVGFHYSSLLDFLLCKKIKVSTLMGLWHSWKLIESTLSSSISFCLSFVS